MYILSKLVLNTVNINFKLPLKACFMYTSKDYKFSLKLIFLLYKLDLIKSIFIVYRTLLQSILCTHLKTMTAI